MVYVIQFCCQPADSQAVSKPVWHKTLLCVHRKTPDDGQRNCPKHVEFYSKNKFKKSVYQFGFIICTVTWTSNYFTVTDQQIHGYCTVYVIQFCCQPASSQAVSKPVWHKTLLCVQRKTPDDRQRNCPKHVEFYSKNKFEKSVYQFGFIIRIYHDARSPERQIISP